MKSITNFLWVIGVCSLAFAYPSKFIEDANIVKIIEKSAKTTDSVVNSKSNIDYRLDSIDTEIKYMHEKGLLQASTDNQVLQNKKEELLQLAVCVDSLYHADAMEVDSIPLCDTVK